MRTTAGKNDDVNYFLLNILLSTKFQSRPFPIQITHQ